LHSYRNSLPPVPESSRRKPEALRPRNTIGAAQRSGAARGVTPHNIALSGACAFLPGGHHANDVREAIGCWTIRKGSRGASKPQLRAAKNRWDLHWNESLSYQAMVDRLGGGAIKFRFARLWVENRPFPATPLNRAAGAGHIVSSAPGLGSCLSYAETTSDEPRCLKRDEIGLNRIRIPESGLF
jgi:hypothetical protein